MVKELFVDFIGIAGLIMLFYGLHSLAPWLAFTVVGALLLAYAIKNG